VARSAQKRRPRKPAAATTAPAKKPRKQERPAYEQQMFFPRLIRQAKWVFVFLALAFAVGFVAFGVGGNLPGTGIGDILQGAGGSTGGPSVGEARDKIEDNPQDPEGHKELGEALLAEGRGDEAIAAYEDYLELRPRDMAVKRTVAGLYMSRANTARDEYAQIYAEYQAQTGGGLFGPPLETQFGRSLMGKIDQELQTIYSQRLGEVNQRMQSAFGQAATHYQQVAATKPDDEALLQLQLGDAAYQARRIPMAVKAYERYVQLDPEGQNAAYAKQQIQLLKAGAANVQPQPG
jgi:tetratricopeptide (TPR) repeat protein